MADQFDMFSSEPRSATRRSERSQGMKRSASHSMTEAEMVDHLTKTGNYRILERLVPRPVGVSGISCTGVRLNISSYALAA
jgi:DNA polymerase-3 subunit epsilon